jgi:hypothetical protein
MKSPLFKFCLIVITLLTFNVFATPDEELQLKEIDVIQERLNIQRDWADFRFEASKNECYSKFFTTSCLTKAKQAHDEEIKRIRSQEVPMHDRQRSLKESLKNQRDIERAAERADPKKSLERENNKKVYEEKQVDKAQREKDLEERRADAQRRSQENKSSTPF